MTVILNPGTYSREELSHVDYLSDRQNVSSHWIKTLVTDNKTPAHLYHNLFENSYHDTPALIRGRVIHTALLEPDLLNIEYVTLDREVEKWSKNSTRYREANADMLQLCRAKGMILISNELMDLAQAIQMSVLNSATAKEILSNCITEHSLVYKDHEIVTSKIRADIVYRDSMVIDVKTAADANERAFKNSIARFGYDIQAAHYHTGAEQEWDIKDYGWLVIEPEPPYAVAFWSADAEILQTGYSKRSEGLEILAHCLTTNEWPSYPDKFMPIQLPGYAVRDSK